MGDGEDKLMNLIQYRANALWDNLSSPETIEIYKQALAKTWNLLKETVILIFMLFLLLVVCVFWVWHIGFTSGREFRQWMESENPQPKELVDKIINKVEEIFEKIFTEVEKFVEKNMGLELPELNPGSEKKENNQTDKCE